ncbi:MAG: hypothetical protein R3F60_17515 [bacterium]
MDPPVYFSDGTVHLKGRASFAWGLLRGPAHPPGGPEAPTGPVLLLKAPVEPRLGARR